MLKNCIALITAMFLICQCLETQAAGKFSYDSFYDSDPEFKKLDEKLNKVYKEAAGGLSGQDRTAFTGEQRGWHNDIFPMLVEDKQHQKNPAEAARGVLEDRIANLEKFINAPKSAGIMGLPIEFGMSRAQVAAKLYLGEKINASPRNDISPYLMKLFGADVPIYFNFLDTTFKCQDGTDPARFSDFLRNDLNVPAASLALINPGQLKENGYASSKLYEVATGGMDDAKACDALLTDLSKKYKTVYPVYLPIRAILNEMGLASGYEEMHDVAFKNQLFQDRDRYILVDQSWGTDTGEFNISYISAAYMNRHIANFDAIAFSLLETSRFRNSLGILPEMTGLEDAIYTVGGNPVEFAAHYPGYYELWTAIRGQDNRELPLTLYFTADNSLYAIEYKYVESDMRQGFEEELIKRLNKRYRKLDDTPAAVLAFLGYGNNFDNDWETEDNYLHIGSTPHFATQHVLLVINKKEIGKYNAIAKKIDDQKDAERAKDVQEDLGRF